ncbi:MAG: hypothetical protein WA705_31360 [Candidatus Ozemobacteraceae bacterium]
MFLIPAAAIGGGVALIVWGSHMFLSNDNSADEKAAEILSRIPEKFEEYIERISVTSSGVHISFRAGTPWRIKEAIISNIEVE